MLCGPSSNCTMKTYCLVGSGIQIFVLALTPGFIFLSIFVAVNVRLPLCVWVTLDELLCATSEMIASVRWSDGAKATILLSATSRFSEAAE